MFASFSVLMLNLEMNALFKIKIYALAFGFKAKFMVIRCDNLFHHTV